MEQPPQPPRYFRAVNGAKRILRSTWLGAGGKYESSTVLRHASVLQEREIESLSRDVQSDAQTAQVMQEWSQPKEGEQL